MRRRTYLRLNEATEQLHSVKCFDHFSFQAMHTKVKHPDHKRSLAYGRGLSLMYHKTFQQQ